MLKPNILSSQSIAKVNLRQLPNPTYPISPYVTLVTQMDRYRRLQPLMVFLPSNIPQTRVTNGESLYKQGGCHMEQVEFASLFLRGITEDTIHVSFVSLQIIHVDDDL